MTRNQSGINHIAVILDGNGRWATNRGLPKIEGHRAGAEAVKKLIKDVANRSIPYLTIYALSSENLMRPKNEVSNIMGLIGYFIDRELNELNANDIKWNIIGSLDEFSPSLRKKLRDSSTLTQNNKKLILTTALGYGSKAEITNACASIVRQGIQPDQITEQTIKEHMYDPEMPDVDLFIRPGGHIRMSNFLLWQSAYAELFFTNTLWPDFDSRDLDESIQYFQTCKRNFGFSRDQKRDIM